MSWHDFTAACPELASLATERFHREQIFLLGTLRPNGTPRISGLECDFVDGELMSGMIWQSAKATDLLRDERMTIHSLVPDKEHESQNQGDIKLYGTAHPITDPDRRRRYERAIEARIDWCPPEPYHCFAFDIDSAGMVRFVGESREVWSWQQGGRLVKRTAPVLPPE